MTNGEKYKEVFGTPHPSCPTRNCADCPETDRGPCNGHFWKNEWVGTVYNSTFSNSNDLLNWLNSKLTPDTPLDYARAIYDVIQYIRGNKNETY